MESQIAVYGEKFSRESEAMQSEKTQEIVIEPIESIQVEVRMEP